MTNFFDFIFPKHCFLCKKTGEYVCDRCKKTFQRQLPECYICRRISPFFNTHTKCRKQISLDRIFVAWEYNQRSAEILKIYKYKSVTDIQKTISKLFIQSIIESSFSRYLKDTVLVPIPISFFRRNQRGFNQAEEIAQDVGKYFGIENDTKFVSTKETGKHQAILTEKQRKESRYNPFFINKNTNNRKFRSITLVDDVITTGTTLEKVSSKIKEHYGDNLEVQALCLFRGKHYF